MKSHSISKDSIEDHVKIFLSVLDLGERLTFTGSDKDMFWFKRSNFLSLLNLPH